MSTDAGRELATTDEGGSSLDAYDPDRGLKSIAIAEAAEKYYARAKDAELLYGAVEAKLTEQRNFVLWWDAQGRGDGGRPRKNPNGSDRVLVLADLGVDHMTVHRWRTKLSDAKKFDATLEAARERCRRVCEAERGSTDQKGASGTGENEWYTPPEYLNAARKVLGSIDLDPASSDKAQETVEAAEYFTPEIDGLTQEWHGRIWLNPPYAQPHIANFVSKLVQEISIGNTTSAIMLTHNYTDTAWFHEAAGMCDAICFTRGRVKFYSAAGEVAAPTQGQAFFYFGDNVAAFAERFAGVGFVVAPLGVSP